MRLLACVVAAVGLGVLLTACGSSSDEMASPPETVEPIDQPADTTTVVPDRERAPALAGTSLDGARIALADLRGQPVLVNVWSSW